jgi:hypothetical protein
MGQATTRQKKSPLGLNSVNFDHEIMEIEIICSNLIEKSHHSSNPRQNTTSNRKSGAILYNWILRILSNSSEILNKSCRTLYWQNWKYHITSEEFIATQNLFQFLGQHLENVTSKQAAIPPNLHLQHTLIPTFTCNHQKTWFVYNGDCDTTASVQTSPLGTTSAT